MAKPTNHSHSHNLSINSISSIAEPTTPPTASSLSGNPKLHLWDSNKLNGNFALPTFNLDSQVLPDYLSHTRQVSIELLTLSDKENNAPTKVDKEYLASLGKVSLLQLQSDILRLAKDQHGCRFLQKRIDPNCVTNSAQRMANFEIIFKEIFPLLHELIVDPFGNYLIQKMVDYCSQKKLNAMMDLLQFNLFLISINQHGTRALQKIIGRMNTDHQLEVLTRGLKPFIVELIKDLNGNHVIQKILNKYEPPQCQFVYDSIIEDILVVATHKHGCCVLQKCLNHVTRSQLVAFSAAILHYGTITQLLNDQFGNYVLQYLISIDSYQVDRRLFENIVAYGMTDLCSLKYSSNVIEKLLKNCYVNEPKSIEFSKLKFCLIHAILVSDLNRIINDAYGNYVVQTVLDTLINPTVYYYIELLNGECVLLPDLQVLTYDNYQNSMESLQIQVIKRWFHNCKISSSFGKRIQLKINVILNGNTRSFNRRQHPSSKFSHCQMPRHSLHVQNMNANGEFICLVPLDHGRPVLNSRRFIQPSETGYPAASIPQAPLGAPFAQGERQVHYNTGVSGSLGRTGFDRRQTQVSALNGNHMPAVSRLVYEPAYGYTPGTNSGAAYPLDLAVTRQSHNHEYVNPAGSAQPFWPPLQ